MEHCSHVVSKGNKIGNGQCIPECRQFQRLSHLGVPISQLSVGVCKFPEALIFFTLIKFLGCSRFQRHFSATAMLVSLVNNDFGIIVSLCLTLWIYFCKQGRYE